MPKLARPLVALAFLAFAPLVFGGGRIPDNLGGGDCWQATTPFVSVDTQRGLYGTALRITWFDCAVESTAPYTAWFGPFRAARRPGIPPVDSVFAVHLDLRDATTNEIAYTGRLRAFYSRTWFERAPRELQVYRFLLNGDLSPRPGAGPAPAGYPTCQLAFDNKVHFTGYIDVTRFSFGGLGTLVAWALDHECDEFAHADGSSRAGSFHPGRSYTIVGPGEGFVPSADLPSAAGTSVLEAVRPLDLESKLTANPATGDVCLFEEPLESASVTPIADFCACPLPTGPAQYRHSSLDLASRCGTTLRPFGSFPAGLLSKSIGTWTNPDVFPGVESLFINAGSYWVTEPCRPRDEPHFFHGVTTRGGIEARTLGGALLPPTFVDQGNAVSFPNFTPVRHVKFVSDLVVNLNLP